MFQTKINRLVHFTVSILPLRCEVDLFFDATLIWDGARIDLGWCPHRFVGDFH